MTEENCRNVGKKICRFYIWSRYVQQDPNFWILNNFFCRIKRNESKLPKMSKEYRNEFRKDTIGENVSQEMFSHVHSVLYYMGHKYCYESHHESWLVKSNPSSILQFFGKLQETLILFNRFYLSWIHIFMKHSVLNATSKGTLQLLPKYNVIVM